MTIQESMHVVFDETNPKLQDQLSKNANEDDLLQENNFVTEKHSIVENQSTEKKKQPTEKATNNNLPKDLIEPKGLSKDNIIGDIKQGVSTRRRLVFCEHVAFVSQIEPKTVNDALNGNNWIVAMKDELNQFTRNDVWFLVPKSDDINIIGTKWVFRNKMDEDGNIVRNKARLVAKGYNQEKTLILIKHMHLQLGQKLLDYSQHMLACVTLNCIKWM